MRCFRETCFCSFESPRWALKHCQKPCVKTLHCTNKEPSACSTSVERKTHPQIIKPYPLSTLQFKKALEKVIRKRSNGTSNGSCPIYLISPLIVTQKTGTRTDSPKPVIGLFYFTYSLMKTSFDAEEWRDWRSWKDWEDWRWRDWSGRWVFCFAALFGVLLNPLGALGDSKRRCH